jgi:hypothetical protein
MIKASTRVDLGFRLVMTSLLVLTSLFAWPARTVRAATTNVDLPTPAGSVQFGESVTMLANGNFVVVDPGYDGDVGAVYLYDPAGVQISRITGGHPGDRVGNDGIKPLSNGNFVILSTDWGDGTALSVGAATWCNGALGCSGVVSAANSLVGSTFADRVGGGLALLPNGNYVVINLDWDNGLVTDAGAVTWCDGAAGCSGVVSDANSLVGSSDYDRVGEFGIVQLSNSNYVVTSPYWDYGVHADVGAVTWCSGTSGCQGAVSATNSLTSSDASAWFDVLALTNGNYVVSNTDWNGGKGAVTWCSGMSGCQGEASATDSLVGNAVTDWVGENGAVALTNGNYVVVSPSWAGGRGAVTWCSGLAGGCANMVVGSTNSLVGSVAGDQAGSDGVVALSNGNYVVSSPGWSNGGSITSAGAVTWGDGASGTSGVVATANSLVGSAAYDQVGRNPFGSGLTALTNGNYVVPSANWNNTRGAVTWCGGTAGGCSGLTVAATNSLVGSVASDRVGSGGVTALNNDNYVVSSPDWSNGGVVRAGAVTWGSGVGGVTGAVLAGNSLVGSSVNDGVGEVKALSNGNYVVTSRMWDYGSVSDAGAVTWGSGTGDVTGAVAAANSLVGSTKDDQIGNGGVTPLSNGHYWVGSPTWDQGGIVNAGAVTWGNGISGAWGSVSAANSLVGGVSNDQMGASGLITGLADGNAVLFSPPWKDVAGKWGAVTVLPGYARTMVGSLDPALSVLGMTEGSATSMVAAYDPSRAQLVVGRPADNKVTILRLPAIAVAAGGNWSAAATWDRGPIASNWGAMIPNGSSVTLDTNRSTAFLDLQTGGRLSIPGSQSLAVSGAAAYNGTLAFTGSAAQTIPAGLTLGGLEIQNSAGVSLGGPLSVNGSLSLLNGVLHLGGYDLTLGPGANVTGTPSGTNMVDASGSGALIKQFSGVGSFTYPIGDSGGNYTPATLNFISGSFSGGWAGVHVQAAKHPNLNSVNYLKRYWTVTSGGISSFNAVAQFSYVLADIVGVGEFGWVGLKFDAPSSWTGLNPLDAFNQRLVGNVTSFSDFTAGPDVPTAVLVSDLAAAARPGGIDLTWNTPLPDQIQAFQIERAVPEGAWQTLAEIPAGVSQQYVWRDGSAQAGQRYIYRLTAITWSGATQSRQVEILNVKNWLFLPAIVR